jgi:predicted RNA-binding protein YlxR (DUF448 family)
VRIVRGADGGVSMDPTGKAPGRGAYLCLEPECWTRALQRGALAHALRTTVSDADRAALGTYRDSLVAAAGVE